MIHKSIRTQQGFPNFRATKNPEKSRKKWVLANFPELFWLSEGPPSRPLTWKSADRGCVRHGVRPGMFASTTSPVAKTHVKNYQRWNSVNIFILQTGHLSHFAKSTRGSQKKGKIPDWVCHIVVALFPPVYILPLQQWSEFWGGALHFLTMLSRQWFFPDSPISTMEGVRT